jgi:hypothetical protein
MYNPARRLQTWSYSEPSTRHIYRRMLSVVIAIAVLLAGVVAYAAAIYHRLGRLKHLLRVRVERLQKDLIVTTLLDGERYCDPRHLCRFEAQVYSQHGEDGILSEILGRIGETNRVFVEIGSGDGNENNTRYRLDQGWSGFWFDADETNVRRSKSMAPDSRLRVVHANVTAENIAHLMVHHGVPVTFDLLSLDIDRNTSHIWRALGHLAPRVVVVEYNASIPRDDPWEIDYRADATWDGSLRFGASLRTLQALGESLGFILVACELSGSNAFFVRRELVDDQFVGPFTARALYEPPRYYLAGRPGHPSRLNSEHVPEHQNAVQLRPASHGR